MSNRWASAVGSTTLTPLVLLGRYHAVGDVLGALARRVLALLELRRFLGLAFLLFLPLLEFVIRLLCHVVVKSGEVEQIGS